MITVAMAVTTDAPPLWEVVVHIPGGPPSRTRCRHRSEAVAAAISTGLALAHFTGIKVDVQGCGVVTNFDRRNRNARLALARAMGATS